MSNKLNNIFAENVFNLKVMKDKLPKSIYKKMKKTIEEGAMLPKDISDIVANVMKDWALEKGATHYTHWFHPMTGKTAQKLDSFIERGKEGNIILELSGKNLIQGEPDASSFPSGGLRATFEARGYTAWDATSYAFIREEGNGKTLYIPTAFYSYTGEALDEKTPLLRSMDVLSKESIRILNLLGKDNVSRVISNVGAEQEYFLIDKKYFDRRTDLLLTGRTLFGAKAPKGQELDDHYFGMIKERIAKFMNNLDEQLWKLGIMAKTKHNEVAPAQHELAPIYETANVSTDQNHLVMDLIKKIAPKYNLEALLHEKPFANLNGSGKHNNWSLSTNYGENLLNPKDSPHENIQFLIFLVAIIVAIDKYPELLRISAANAGNDHRLGANEAPPAIISIFLGERLTDLLEQLKNGKLTSSKEAGEFKNTIPTLPDLNKDATDRNRTSPFAFTGNKFEFRAVASSSSIAMANIVLNTTVASVLKEIADKIEKTNKTDDDILSILQTLIQKHDKIIFNGNGYSENWPKEAQERGLPNLKTTVDAIPELISKKSIELFESMLVFTKNELNSRYHIMLENYYKKIDIESKTMLYILDKELIPSILKVINKVSNSIISIKSISKEMNTQHQENILNNLLDKFNKIEEKKINLSNKRNESKKIKNILELAQKHKNDIIPAMDELREIIDKIEITMPSEDWPLPDYTQLLFKI